MFKSCLTSIWLLAVAFTLIVLNQFVFDLPDEPKPDGAFFDAGGGVRMHYVERAGRGPAIVLIHGLPGTHRDFDAVVKRLPGRRVIALDRPGFGLSTGGTRNLFDQAESIHRLLAAKGVTGATVVGHSYGGPVAFALAHEHARDVGRIVSLAGAAGGIRPEAMDKVNARVIGFTHLPVIEQINELFVGNMVLRGVGELQLRMAFEPDDVDPSYKPRLLSTTLKDDDLMALRGNILSGDRDHARVDRLLAKIRQPAVIVQGLGDMLVNARFAREIAREMPNAKLVMIPGGHMIPIVRPATVVKQIRAVERR